jgi:hypothetical protein
MITTVSNNRFLQRVNPQITRALADSGSSLNHSEIQLLARNMVDLGLWGNLKLWVHSGLVKTRESGGNTFVSKAYDISGGNNDPAQTTEDNQPKLVSSYITYDGVNDYMLINDSASLRLTSEGSLMLWINPSTLTQDSFANFIAKSRRGTTATISYFIIWRQSGGYLQGYISDGTNFKDVQATLPNTANQYYHIVFTWDASYLRIYQNAGTPTSASNSSSISAQSASDQNVCLGGNTFWTDSTNLAEFTGIQDDYRIFNKALSATEISAIYNITKSKYGH